LPAPSAVPASGRDIRSRSALSQLHVFRSS
jgi:hypothetical protein